MRILLIVPFILETTTSLPPASGVILTAVATCLPIATSRLSTAWKHPLPQPTTWEITLVAYVAMMVFLVSVMLKEALVKKIAQDDRIIRLEQGVERLVQANVKFQQQSLAVEEKSKIDERRRITRDIHDTIGYTLTNAVIILEAAAELLPEGSEESRRKLMEAEEQIKAGFIETRRALRVLRSADYKSSSGIDAIQKLLKAFSMTASVEIQAEYGNLPWSLGAPIDTVLYRIAQEGIVNAFRHGKATKISLVFWKGDDGVSVLIRDNGEGSSGGVIHEGIGLAGMNERIKDLGGSLEASNTIGGFELSAWIPLYTESSKR